VVQEQRAAADVEIVINNTLKNIIYGYSIEMKKYHNKTAREVLGTRKKRHERKSRNVG
jgi:hypothetical protein